VVHSGTPKIYGRYLSLYLAIATYGKDWKKIEEIVGTRSGSQVRSHAQKFFNKLLKSEGQNKKNSCNKKS